MSDSSILPQKLNNPNAPALLVVIATFNEVENLPVLVPRILELFPECRILVVDDDSTDGTGQWCDLFHNNDPRLSVIHRVDQRGLGTATLAGFNWGLHRSFDLIATMDADLSHDPDTLLAMWDVLTNDSDRNFGLVIGSRYVPGGGVRGWPWYRRVASWLVNRYVRWCLWLRTHDNTSAYRLYRSSSLEQIDLSAMTCTGYAYLEEILWRLQLENIQAVEVPIVFVDRVQGQSKVRPAVLVQSLFEVLKMSAKNIFHQCRGNHDAS